MSFRYRRGLAAKTSGTAGIADTAVSLRNKHVAIKKSNPFLNSSHTVNKGERGGGDGLNLHEYAKTDKIKTGRSNIYHK
jgi:hypothetical protein